MTLVLLELQNRITIRKYRQLILYTLLYIIIRCGKKKNKKKYEVESSVHCWLEMHHHTVTDFSKEMSSNNDNLKLQII